MFRTVIVLLLLTAALPAFATDLTIVYQVKVGKKTGEKIMYWSDRFQRVTDPLNKTDTLTDNEKGILYMIDHSKKRIEVLNFNSMSSMMGQMAPMMEQAMNMKGMGEKLQKGVEKRLGKAEDAPLQKLGSEQIAGRNCDKYRVERKGKDTMIEEVCIDPTLMPPGNTTPAGEQMQASAAQMMQGSLGSFVAAGDKELQNIKGAPLRRYTKMNKRENSETATEIKQSPIDPSVFKLPENYQQINQAQMMQEQMGEAQKMMEKYNQ